MYSRVGTVALFAAWVVLAVGSILIPMQTAPTDFGFTKGLNRIELFFRFQFFAALVAMALLYLSGKVTSRALRWLCRLPALAFGLLCLAVLGVFLWASFGPEPQTDYTPSGLPTAVAPQTD